MAQNIEKNNMMEKEQAEHRSDRAEEEAEARMKAEPSKDESGMGNGRQERREMRNEEQLEQHGDRDERQAEAGVRGEASKDGCDIIKGQENMVMEKEHL